MLSLLWLRFVLMLQSDLKSTLLSFSTSKDHKDLGAKPEVNGRILAQSGVIGLIRLFELLGHFTVLGGYIIVIASISTRMSILLKRGLWFNGNVKLLSFVRKITTFVPKYEVSTTSYLSLNSYCQEDASDRVFSMNRNIDSLIKSGDLDSALKLFDEMPMHDVVSYNLLISGHRRFGLPRPALWLYAEMVSLGIRESSSTFSSVLGICSEAGLYEEGIQVHCRALSLGLSSNVFIGTAAISLYMLMGLNDVALRLFDELPVRSLATWNLVLRGSCELARVDEILGLFLRMKLDGFDPNGVSFSYLIRGCSNGRCFEEGKQLHCHVIKAGLVEMNVFVANALVDFYSACESLTDSRRAFEAIPVKDVISWNSIVWVYANHGLALDALELFSEMRFRRTRPSVRSLVGLLSLACAIDSAKLGKQIHSYAVKSGFDFGSLHVQSALINMYGKCDEVSMAVKFYDFVGDKTLECCNSLMTSLLRNGCFDDVVEMFGSMVDEGTGIDEVTLSTTLKALSASPLLSSTAFGSVHSCALKSGLGSDISVSTSLIDAYSKRGHVSLARRVFDEIHSPKVISFTSIVNGYAQNGMGKESLELFQEMTRKGLKPDRVTFLCVLSGCNHSGLVREARLLFDSMERSYGICPNRHHYSCMVDLLGRAGLLDEAEELLNLAPRRGDSTMWSSLLRSCRVYKNETLGRRAAKILLELETDSDNDPSVFLQASSFYSEIGEFSTAKEIRELGLARTVMREIGHSLIETRGYK